MIIDFKDYSANATYHIMTQAIVPRPIAWVLTQNTDGKTTNLAPFSYFTAVSSDPALLMFSVMPKEPGGTPKDTLKNILANQQFVVHIAHSRQLAAVQNSAEPLSYGDSEVEANDLALCDFAQTGQQRLVDAPLAMACQLYQIQNIGDTQQQLVFGQITHLFVDDSAVTNNKNRISIDANSVSPPVRLGAGFFADIHHIRRVK